MAGYLGQTVGANGPAANVGYNNATDQIVKQLEADGSNIVPVDAVEEYDPNTMVSSDLRHPTDYGHAIPSSSQFFNAMEGTRYGNGKGFSQFLDGAFPSITFGTNVASTSGAFTIDGVNNYAEVPNVLLSRRVAYNDTSG